MRFHLGYVYLVLATTDCAYAFYTGCVSLREHRWVAGVGIMIGFAFTCLALVGLFRRRLWGLVCNSIMLGLMVGGSLWHAWRAFFDGPRVEGFVALALLAPCAVVLYGLFFFIYFFRRRRLFS